MQLRTLHRFSAFVLLVFLGVHVANHLSATLGVQRHIAFMDAARVVYRAPVVEAVLLACVLVQALSGITLVARGWRRRRGGIAWLQAISGIYLAYFLIVHVGAVLFGRAVLGLDTNIHFAAAGMHVPPFQFFFVPYYFLSLLAVSVHLGCAAYWNMRGTGETTRRGCVVAAVLVGCVLGAVVVAALAGQWGPVEIPEPYKAIYRKVITG